LSARAQRGTLEVVGGKGQERREGSLMADKMTGGGVEKRNKSVQASDEEVQCCGARRVPWTTWGCCRRREAAAAAGRSALRRPDPVRSRSRGPPARSQGAVGRAGRGGRPGRQRPADPRSTAESSARTRDTGKQQAAKIRKSRSVGSHELQG
jgi:hypothetical protein